MKTITIDDLKNLQRDSACRVVDVRSAGEFASGHVPGAINIPMDEIDSRLGDVAGSSLLLICHSGQRAALVAERIGGTGTDVCVVQGGTQAWRKAGNPVVQSACSCWSLERQVRLGAGVMVVLSVMLSLLVHRGWIGLAAFVGCGLTFAGLTDICPMGMLLARMPWNRRKPAIVPQVTDAEGRCTG